MAATKKAFITIHSNINITVTPGLQSTDHTYKDSNIPDRLKISPRWSSCLVDIKEGQHIYPSEIVDWPSVQSLVNKKVFTLGAYVDSENEEDLKAKKEVVDKLKEIKVKSKSLNEIAGE